MANVNELVLVIKWKFAEKLNGPDFVCPPGCSWEDITGQPAASLPCNPNVYMIRAFVTDAVYTQIAGNANFIILSRRVYDSEKPGIYTINNVDDKPTGAQLTALKNQIISKFTGVNEDALTQKGKAVFQSGVTRAEAIELLAKRWRSFTKAVK